MEEKKCPKCGSQCYRDEHPDGYFVSPWYCSNENCGWTDKIEQEDDEEINYNNLPF